MKLEWESHRKKAERATLIISANPCIQSVWLFGSTARRKAGIFSDIDIVYTFRPPEDERFDPDNLQREIVQVLEKQSITVGTGRKQINLFYYHDDKFNASQHDDYIDEQLINNMRHTLLFRR